MDLEKIKNAKTVYLGKNIIYFNEINSTQDYAKQILKQNIKTGSIVIADYQTKGKGTKERKWLSSKEKNIMMTIILYPNSKPLKLEGLTVEIAQAIKNAIYKLYKYNLDIKKPNDLYLNNKKIAGILTEATSIKEKVIHLYIGIGFNVNEESFSDEIKDTATSLKKEFNKEFEIEEIIVTILEEIEKVLKERKLVSE